MSNLLKVSSLQNFIGSEFNSYVNDVKVRVILKDVNSKNAIVANYYHPDNSYNVKISSFLDKFKPA